MHTPFTATKRYPDRATALEDPASRGPSGQPSGLFAQLRAWVENGTAPESTPVNVTKLDGAVEGRVPSPYLQKAKPNGGADLSRNTTAAGSKGRWICVEIWHL
ncbi:hypothetical protein B0T26DRAFT_385845 [Lasiosphaeria miniovina]|uniref:Uncharacterized protein n=1 Tax=Lasiosphaeria miniovina TaxID=1954250 RepID=A0AA40AE52_9PEZI|nr:uncharacterized protein B0T26DRAFT_385845 [Lasiosphaeria miniovina]KAK0714145.1 hypothetical protein B0T26DRAFT_385845 [Lasiosphaeria miniovina]